MYAKLNVTFNVDTIVSAIAKFTKNILVTVRIRLWLHTIHITIKLPPVATTTIGRNNEFHNNVSHNGNENLLLYSLLVSFKLIIYSTDDWFDVKFKKISSVVLYISGI